LQKNGRRERAGGKSVDVAKGMRNLVQPKEELMKIRHGREGWQRVAGRVERGA